MANGPFYAGSWDALALNLGICRFWGLCSGAKSHFGPAKVRILQLEGFVTKYRHPIAVSNCFAPEKAVQSYQEN